MRKKRRIFLCCLMTLLMAFVMAVPMSVSAAEGDITTAEELSDAINNANSGDVITLGGDITADVVVKGDKSITLDLNGHKLTNASGDTITVKIGASLTIKGSGTVDNKTNAKGAIFNEGTVILNGGTYDRTSETGESADISGGNSWYTICNHGKMTINEGVTVKNSGSFSSMIENGYYDYTSTDSRNGYAEGVNAKNPTLTINGGEFIGGLNTVKNDDGAILVINDGSFSNTTQASILNWNKAEIYGGEFDCSAENCILNGARSSDPSDNNKGELNIYGGVFSSTGSNVYNNFTSSKGISISAGTFTSSDVSDYLADKYAALVIMNDDEASFIIIPDDIDFVSYCGATHKVTVNGNVYYYIDENDIGEEIDKDNIERIGYAVDFYLLSPDGTEVEHFDTVAVPKGSNVENVLKAVEESIGNPEFKGYEFLGWYEGTYDDWTPENGLVGFAFGDKFSFDSEVNADMEIFSAWQKEGEATPVGPTTPAETTPTEAATTDTTVNEVQTGDDSHMGIVLIMMTLAAAVAVGAVTVKRKAN